MISVCRASLVLSFALVLAVLSGCGETATTTAPLPAVPAASATPPPVPANAPKARNLGGGSSAAQDSTINPQ